MKIAHWSLTNGSGLHHLAMACVVAEIQLGHESLLVDVDESKEWESGIAIDADVHVVHTRFPDVQRYRVKNRTGKDVKLVFVAHGIPEHNIELAVANFLAQPEQYRPVDNWALTVDWLRMADAFVCFSPRQQAIYESMAQKGRIIDLVPLGVDRAFWGAPLPEQERMQGQPAVWISENPARIKWPLDVLIAWPWVCREVPQAFLHAHYLVYDIQRFLIGLANMNGTAAHANMTARVFSHEALRTAWRGCDFMLATTRYGDNTCLTMQAEAAGLATISYPGNEYASYWMPEGDQRTMAAELVRIFKGEVTPREKKAVPDLADMGQAMVAIYERLLAQ